MVGSRTEKELLGLYFDKAFLGANGFIPEEGVFTYDIREARKKELVGGRSRQVFLLADASKRGKRLRQGVRFAPGHHHHHGGGGG